MQQHATSAPGDAPLFNPLAPEFKRDPYPTYAALRRDDPVHRSPLGFWAVTRYDDVVHVLKNHALFSSTAFGMNIGGKATRTVINTDPPEHTRLRNIVSRAFTPRMVADLEPRIREIARSLLDDVAPAGEMDFVADLAVPLPVTVIAEILGVDPALRDDFKRWSSAVVLESSARTDDEKAQIERDLAEFTEYFRAVIDERRRRPTDDLIGVIVRAETEDQELTPDEVLLFTALLLIAGNETTTNLLGSAVAALIDHPDQLDALVGDPALIPAAIEEALRYESPVKFLPRLATQDTAVAGVTIPAGQIVIPIFASANRDERRFPDPDRFDIRRDAHGHVAFGAGVHFCLGAPLARLEAKVALEEALPRLRNLRRTEPELEWINSELLRGLARLPLAFDAA